MSNAAKFTDKGTAVLSVERNGDGWVRFAVRDTGIGMNAEQVNRLFQPFVQADNSISKRFGGTGLGLVISQRFVEMMGGRITVDSELGNGSCVTVSLPDIEPAKEGGENRDDRPLILVVEDTLSDSSLIERYLSHLGYSSYVARDGMNGLEGARELEPVAIILDIELPGMDGFEVLKSLRADEALRSIPVIVSSVHDDVGDRAKELGAREFLAKPLDRDALEASLGKYCAAVKSEAAAVA